MKLDECSRCQRVWLDCRELDWVAAQEKGFLSRLERGVLVEVCDQCLGIRLDGGKLDKMSMRPKELERGWNDGDRLGRGAPAEPEPAVPGLPSQPETETQD